MLKNKQISKILLTLFSFILFFSISSNLFAAQQAGFLPQNIWFSKDSFLEGDKIKIYTLVFNPDQRELYGSVLFFDNDTLLGKKTFSVPGTNVLQISIPWQVTSGQHVIYAKIENTRFLNSPGKYEDVYLSSNESEKTKITIEKKETNIEEKKEAEAKTENSESNNQVSKIGEYIKDNTPSFIAKPTVKIAENLDSRRESIAESLSKEQSKIENDIKKTKEPTEQKSKIKKPLQYIGLFFVSLFKFIFTKKILFYVLLALLIFFTVRFIWRKFFS